MASGAAAAAAASIAVFAIMVLSSLGHPRTGPLCRDCGSLCSTNCTQEVATRCKIYCANPSANRQYCETQVLLACTRAYCCHGYCGSHNCSLEAKTSCQSVHDTTIDCQTCTGGILGTCIPDCNRNCNNTCVNGCY